MDKQKFVVGETVAVYGVVESKYDTDRTEVTDAQYIEGGLLGNHYGLKPHTGWYYQTAHQPSKSYWWREESLVKLPPDKNTFENFIGIVFENKVGEPA